MTNEKINILYVDDENNNLISFKAVFRIKYQVFTAISGVEALKILESKPVQIIITDQRMPGITGIEFLESILPVYPDTIRILLTGFSDINAVMDAINRGQVYKYLVKPWQNDELKMYIENALEIYNLRKENKDLARKLQLANAALDALGRSRL